MKVPVLFEKKEKCCGCGACMNICPNNAISMTMDENGCLYPQINRELCVGCGLCKSVCNYQNNSTDNSILTAYAAKSLDTDTQKFSSSGGLFSALSYSIISAGGVVYGCAYEDENAIITPKHVRISQISEIKKTQGTKYAQSSIGMCFKQVKQDLERDVPVLFSGTPCQVDGLYGFLHNKHYNNLFTIDILCHGVPGTGFFQDYIRSIEAKYKARVIEFNFRDKRFGWNAKGICNIEKNGKTQNLMVTPHNSSYYRLFLDSSFYRDNCYSCKYACSHRVGDITIGDFWGIRSSHPELLGKWDINKGISCLLVNTAQGELLISQFGQNIDYETSSFEKISSANKILIHPCKDNKDRLELRDIYHKYGYDAVEKWYRKRYGLKRYLFLISDKLKYGKYLNKTQF